MPLLILSRIVCCQGHGYLVIWYCVVWSKLLVPHISYTHARSDGLLILHRCFCVEAYVNYLTTKTCHGGWTKGLELGISLICDKSDTAQNLAFLSYWYRKKHLQMHFSQV